MMAQPIKGLYRKNKADRKREREQQEEHRHLNNIGKRMGPDGKYFGER